MSAFPPVPRMSTTLASEQPPPGPRVGVIPVAVILSVLLGIGGSVMLYQNAEVDLETYKALMVASGLWCGGGPQVRTALLSDNRITRAEAQALRVALDTLKARGQKCIDPAPEPVVKERGRT